MGYDYNALRERLFTEEGQRQFLRIRDKVKNLLALAGAFSMEKATAGETGDSWQMLACVDRLVELSEIVELKNPASGWGQHRVFAAARYP